MSSRHHIDDFMRGRIIGKIEEGRKITDVAREFDIAHSVISRLWKSFKTTGMCSRRHGGGRVRSTTPAEDRYIPDPAYQTTAPGICPTSPEDKQGQVHSVVSYRVLKMEVNKEKIRYILQIFFDKSEYASLMAEIVNDVYGANTVTANYVQFWFRRFHSSGSDVKDVPPPSLKMSIK
ncbi:hypothetical protein TNCV_2050741 [Trichonephila clavipes]|nr:hypothetical protein TNCV_2050741 [Trichonephila clavipes]